MNLTFSKRSRLTSIHGDAVVLIALFLVWTALSLSSSASPRGMDQNNTVLPAKTLSQQKVVSPLEASWSSKLRGRNVQDQFNQRSLTIFRLDLTADYQLAPWLKLNVAPSFKAASGYAQSELESEANKNTFMVRNATADFIFISDSKLSIGALNQPEFHTAIMTDERAFPGVRGFIHANPKAPFQWGLFAQNTVATSSSLTANTKDFEPTPSFRSAGLLLGYQQTGLQFSSACNVFEYQNLPSSVAYESGLLGNTLATSTGSDSAFLYEFKGVETKTQIGFNFTQRLFSKLYFESVQNTAAPNGLNFGYIAGGLLELTVSTKWVLSPGYEYFRIEPDTSVAGYSDDRYDNNRVGYRGYFKSTYNRQFRLGIGAGEREVIYLTPNQSREKFIELGLETFDAKL